MSARSAKGFEPFTIEVSASDLPKRILDRFREPPAAEALFAVTVEPAETEAENWQRCREICKSGSTIWRRGRVSDSQQVFARLKARFPIE